MPVCADLQCVACDEHVCVPHVPAAYGHHPRPQTAPPPRQCCLGLGPIAQHIHQHLLHPRPFALHTLHTTRQHLRVCIGLTWLCGVRLHSRRV
jgi:hypothetical protein